MNGASRNVGFGVHMNFTCRCIFTTDEYLSLGVQPNAICCDTTTSVVPLRHEVFNTVLYDQLPVIGKLAVLQSGPIYPRKTFAWDRQSVSAPARKTSWYLLYSQGVYLADVAT